MVRRSDTAPAAAGMLRRPPNHGRGTPKVRGVPSRDPSLPNDGSHTHRTPAVSCTSVHKYERMPAPDGAGRNWSRNHATISRASCRVCRAGEVSFEGSRAGGGGDERFVRLLAMQLASSGSGAPVGAAAKAAGLAKLDLAEGDIAKVALQCRAQ